MTAYTSFLPQVMPYVRDCPQPIIEDAIRNAAIEFCEKTYIWKDDLAAISIVGGTSEYAISVPTGAALVSVEACWYSDRLLIPKGADELARIFRLCDWRSAEGDPVYYTHTTPNSIVVVPTPQNDVADSLKIRAVLCPTRASTTVEDFIYDDYLDTIAAGARARLYAIPGQPFSDMSLALLSRREFLAGVGEAKIKANKGMTRASLRVEFQPM